MKQSVFSIYYERLFLRVQFGSESEEIDVTHKNDSGSSGLVQKSGPADLPDRDCHPHAAEEWARSLCPGREEVPCHHRSAGSVSLRW